MTTLDRPGPGASSNVAAERSDANNFARRVASALILAPVALAAAYSGGWLFLGACLLAAGVILSEWTLLVSRGADLRMLVPGIAALLVAAVLAGRGELLAATASLGLGAVLTAAAVAFRPGRFSSANAAAWGAAGAAYAGVALLAPVWLRGDPEYGLAALSFLFATVWATDIFAYLVGRILGGPLLWPQLSPKKTWAGAVGGLVGGVAAGWLVAYASAGTKPVAAGVLASVLSIVAQGGDLFESGVKRRFGVKDASHLIPGHGGLMDRLDGFLVAALIALLIGIVHQGAAAPGRGLLVW